MKRKERYLNSRETRILAFGRRDGGAGRRLLSMNSAMLRSFTQIVVVCAMVFVLSFPALLFADDPISRWDMADQMGPGINCVWSTFAGDIANYATTETLDFRNEGFINFRLRTDEEDLEELFSFLDEMIQDVLDSGGIAIIAKGSSAFKDDPSSTTVRDAWVDWWEGIADHYKNYSHKLMFNLITEVTAASDLSDAPIDMLNEAYDLATTAIRNTGSNNATRIIIIGGPKRSDPFRMDELDIPTDADGYLIGEFHEGFAAGPKHNPPLDAADKLEITSRFDAAVDWRTSTGHPVWEGAWMPGDYNKGDSYTIEEQIEFSEFFVSELKARDIPFAVNTSNKFYDDETYTWNFRKPVVDAIMETWYGDSTPPAAPTGLVATAGDEEVSLDWNDNTEDDLSGYNVYRSTTSGSGFSKINGSLVSASVYTDSTVSNDTTYYYVVTAVDTSTNESGYSNEDSAMPASNDIYVYDITMGGYESKTNYYCATATVWIKDDSLNNINGATVYGTWSGATKKGDGEKTTGTDGKAILTSSAVKGGGTFTFTVTNVTATGYNYNSSLNNEDYDSITVP